MSDKLAEVNATLDRFAKLIEANAQQLIKDKAEFDRRLAKDQEEAKRKEAADKAKWEQQRIEWEQQRIKWEQQRAEWEQQRAEWEKRFNGINSRLGGQGNSIGEITEALTISDNIIDLVNEFNGINVEYFSFNITKKYPAKTAEGKATLIMRVKTSMGR